MDQLRRNSRMGIFLAAVLGAASCGTHGTQSVSDSDAGAKSNTGQTGGSGAGGSATGGASTGSSGGKSGGGGASTSSGNGGTTGAGGSSASGGTSGGGAGGGGTNNAGGSGGSSATRDAGPGDGPGVRTDGNISTGRDGRTPDSACPTGQALCGGSCVDIMGSASNCGGCGTACGSDQVCSAGSCVGTTANDGCSDTLASNLTLQQIAVYQTVKVPIMNNGSEVASASRNAGVVNGRPTLVRVFVTPGSGWTARALSARLTLVPSGGQPAVYTSKKTISAASTDADTNSTFQFTIPAASMVTGLAYSVQVVECGTASGSPGQASFPSTGTLDMGVHTTGPLKVTLIPLQYTTLLPDTSDTALAPYVAQMMAMYPITNISFTVGDTLTVTSISDWSGMLDQVRAKRAADKPATDVYYFGMLKPASTLRAYCQSSCTTGIGYVVSSATGTTAANSRAAMGIAFGDSASTTTMAHEIGHNHGRNHAPCSTAGTISGVDANYPAAYTNAIIGDWGWDSRTQTFYDPSKYKDIMSYCSPLWISDYNYSALVTRVAAVNGVSDILVANAEVAKWRIMLVDNDFGPRWGIPLDDATPAEGEAELAVVYDASGQELTYVRVYRTDVGDLPGAASYMVPPPQSNWYAIAVKGAAPLPFAAPMPRL